MVSKEHINDALSGYGVSIDKVLPKKTRKIYPLHYFTSFKEHEVISEKEVKNIPHLICTKCGDDLAEGGNGMYYTGYIVIHKNDHFSIACSKSCLPENSICYHDQIYGNRNYVVLPNKSRIIWSMILFMI